MVGGGEVGGKATDFGDFPHLRCLLALLRGGKATDFSTFSHLRCLLALLRGGEATDFAGFPFLRCLLALLRGGKAADFSAFPIYVALTPTPPKTIFFAKPIVTPPLVWYNTGYHRIVIQGIIVCFQTCLHGWGTSFETLVQSTGMEI